MTQKLASFPCEGGRKNIQSWICSLSFLMVLSLQCELDWEALGAQENREPKGGMFMQLLFPGRHNSSCQSAHAAPELSQPTLAELTTMGPLGKSKLWHKEQETEPDQIGSGDDRAQECIHKFGRASELSAQASGKKLRINRDVWLALGWRTPRSIHLPCGFSLV